MRVKKFVWMSTSGLVCLLLFWNAALAQPSSYTVSAVVKEAYNRFSSHPDVKKGLEFIKSDHENTVTEQKQLCATPAPPFQEKNRAEDFRRRLAALGLREVQMDMEGNICGLLPGVGKGPKLLVAAHLDTVFPQGRIPL